MLKLLMGLPDTWAKHLRRTVGVVGRDKHGIKD